MCDVLLSDDGNPNRIGESEIELERCLTVYVDSFSQEGEKAKLLSFFLHTSIMNWRS